MSRLTGAACLGLSLDLLNCAEAPTQYYPSCPAPRTLYAEELAMDREGRAMDAHYIGTTGEPDTDYDLENVIARIMAHGAGRRLPVPSPEGIAIFLAHAGQEKPMRGEELEEHERMWRAVDAEIKSLDSGPAWNGGPA